MALNISTTICSTFDIIWFGRLDGESVVVKNPGRTFQVVSVYVVGGIAGARVQVSNNSTGLLVSNGPDTTGIPVPEPQQLNDGTVDLLAPLTFAANEDIKLEELNGVLVQRIAIRCQAGNPQQLEVVL